MREALLQVLGIGPRTPGTRWAINILAPRIEKALRVAIKKSYKAGLAFNRGITLVTGDDCVEAFIEKLKK